MTHQIISASKSHAFNICVATQQLGNVVSGVGLHARNLVSQLCADGHRVTVVAPVDQQPSEVLGYRFVGVPRPWPAQNQARWFWLSVSFARVISQLQSKERFDLIHFTDGREALFCRSNIPLVGNVNDTYSAEASSPGYYRRYYNDWLFRWVYYHFVRRCEAIGLPRLQAVLANSRYTAEAITGQYHLKPRQVHTIYKSIDAERYQGAP